MACGSCGFGADFLTSCHHMFCYACFSNYMNHKPDYPIKCLCCERILTPKECLENLFGDDKEVFKGIRDSYLSYPSKHSVQRISLDGKSESNFSEQKQMEEFEDIISEKKSYKRQYKEVFMKYGFYFSGTKENPNPLCLLCHKVLSNSSMKKSHLERHFKCLHAIHANESIAFFQEKLYNLQNRSIDVSMQETMEDNMEFNEDLASYKTYPGNDNDALPSNCIITKSTKRPSVKKSLPLKFQYAAEKEIYHFKDPICERITCPGCQEEHTSDETCEEWRERNGELLEKRKKLKVESHLGAYSKFLKVFGRFNTERELLDKCKSLGFIHTWKRCPKPACNTDLRPSSHTGKPVWRCNKCNTTNSIKQNTWFFKSWLSYFDILQITFCWVIGVSHEIASEVSGKSRHTVQWWYRKCRRHTIDIIEKTAWRIGGPNVHVEVDSIMLGRARINKGGRRAPNLYMGLIEQGNIRSLIVLPIVDCSTETLEAMITRWVLPGSIIHTDEWFGASNLHNLGYAHIVNGGTSSFTTNYCGSIVDTAESTWDFVKSGCPPKGSKRKFMTSYIMAKIWRQRNECLTSLEKFERFMKSTLNCDCTKEPQKRSRGSMSMKSDTEIDI